MSNSKKAKTRSRLQRILATEHEIKRLYGVENDRFRGWQRDLALLLGTTASYACAVVSCEKALTEEKLNKLARTESSVAVVERWRGATGWDSDDFVALPCGRIVVYRPTLSDDITIRLPSGLMIEVAPFSRVTPSTEALIRKAFPWYRRSKEGYGMDGNEAFEAWQMEGQAEVDAYVPPPTRYEDLFKMEVV